MGRWMKFIRARRPADKRQRRCFAGRLLRWEVSGVKTSIKVRQIGELVSMHGKMHRGFLFFRKGMVKNEQTKTI